jgi:hypothetical protein
MPLNTKCQKEVFVYNEAFVESCLKVELPVDEAHFTLKVTFPKGDLLEHTMHKLPVLQTF